MSWCVSSSSHFLFIYLFFHSFIPSFIHLIKILVNRYQAHLYFTQVAFNLLFIHSIIGHLHWRVYRLGIRQAWVQTDLATFWQGCLGKLFFKLLFGLYKIIFVKNLLHDRKKALKIGEFNPSISYSQLTLYIRTNT